MLTFSHTQKWSRPSSFVLCSLHHFLSVHRLLSGSMAPKHVGWIGLWHLRQGRDGGVGMCSEQGAGRNVQHAGVDAGAGVGIGGAAGRGAARWPRTR